MIKPPAAAISTTETYSPGLRVNSESMKEQQGERGENENGDLRDACGAARGEQKIAAVAECRPSAA